MKQDPFKETLEEIEGLIRGAQIEQARVQLLRLKPKEIPREWAHLICQLSRRVGLVLFSLKVLNPIVRPKTPIHPKPTAAEMAEYAASLGNIGATDEALAILKKVDLQIYPQSILYHSLISISQWNYQVALPLLKKYIRVTTITNYQRTVGKINLAATLIAIDKFEAANEVLEQIEKELDPLTNTLLYGNYLELSAQSYFLNKKFSEARTLIQKGISLLESSQHLSVLFLKKWSVIIDLTQNGATPEIINRINVIKKESQKNRHWETLRHLDLYLSLALRDDFLFAHVYLGTPFKEYRKKMKSLYRPEGPIPKNILWNPHALDPLQKTQLVLDVRTGILEREGLEPVVQIKPNQSLHRALSTLCKDFYRPLREGELHAGLFYGDYFNPYTSPGRISKTIGRLRAWFRQYNVPIHIVVENGEYHLSFREDFSLRVPLAKQKIKKNDIYLETLKVYFLHRQFSTQRASKVLGLPKRTVIRILQEALMQKKLLRIGKGRSTGYRFAR